MSWEGYYQVICEFGHAATREAYGPDPKETPCDVCKGKIKWYNVVDQTNGSFADDGKTRIDGMVRLRIKKPKKTKKCYHCGHDELVAHETYQIPKTKGQLIVSE